ncbi:uncharacterized protein LOC142488188 [Ascaphus truei]|uniref:uncharacterized protein LOC142488188 n=1 Tax=Ascaphus truei TaxID=8439 RepID=UPI003F5ACF38
MLLLYIVAPGGHVSPEMEQVSSPGSCSSTHLEEHDDEDYDDDDDDDAAIDTEIQASDHEEVPIETVLPPNRPATTTYDAIVASEGKIVEAENRRHSDLMTVLEMMIALQEETVSQLAHLHRVFIEVPKQLQKINTSFEALVVQQTQANYLRMTNVPQFNLNTSQAGSVHAGQFSPHASDLHSPGPNVTGQVADIAVQVPDDILPLLSVQNQELTPTKEAKKTKHHKQPGAKSEFPKIGAIKECCLVRANLYLLLSHTANELSIAQSGLLMVLRTFFGSQIRSWSATGAQQAASSSTQRLRLGVRGLSDFRSTVTARGASIHYRIKCLVKVAPEDYAALRNPPE